MHTLVVILLAVAAAFLAQAIRWAVEPPRTEAKGRVLVGIAVGGVLAYIIARNLDRPAAAVNAPMPGTTDLVADLMR